MQFYIGMTSFNQLSEEKKELHRKVCNFTILQCRQIRRNIRKKFSKTTKFCQFKNVLTFKTFFLFEIF